MTPEDALNMIALTPTERLEWILKQDDAKDVHPLIGQLFELYGQFLTRTNVPEAELVERFLDKEQAKEYFSSASEFGDVIFRAIPAIGKESKLHRMLIV